MIAFYRPGVLACDASSMYEGRDKVLISPSCVVQLLLSGSWGIISDVHQALPREQLRLRNFISPISRSTSPAIGSNGGSASFAWKNVPRSLSSSWSTVAENSFAP